MTDQSAHVHTLLIDSMEIGQPVLSVMHQRIDGAPVTLTRTPAGTGNSLVQSFDAADITYVGFEAAASMAELIVYDRALTAAEIIQVETYLGTRYAL